MKKYYKIQSFDDHLKSTGWSSICGFEWMQKSYARGAWGMLRAFRGGSKKYRLVEQETGEIIAEYNTGKVGVPGDMR